MKTSSLIQKFVYQKDHQTLFVRFTSGKEYNYFGVPTRAVKKLEEAETKGESVGRAFNQAIKDRYDYQVL